MNKPMVKRDSLAEAIDGGPIEWARYHREHRDLVSLNDWQMARRNKSGTELRRFLLKCAYFFSVQQDWTMDQFAHECGISVSTATYFDREMRGIYPSCAGLRSPKVPNTAKAESKQRYHQMLSNMMEQITNANQTVQKS